MCRVQKHRWKIFNWNAICFYVNKRNDPAAKLLQLWDDVKHQSENGILFHNEAAIRIEQKASSHKGLRQQDGENILMTNYILRCAHGLYPKLRLRFNPVSKEQYYFKIPHRPYGLFYMTQISGLFSLFYCSVCTANKLCHYGRNNIGIWLVHGGGSHHN